MATYGSEEFWKCCFEGITVMLPQICLTTKMINGGKEERIGW
jgi:hypothetical protein